MTCIYLLSTDFSQLVQIHEDGIALLGSAIGSDDYLTAFLEDKLQQITMLLGKVGQIQSLQSKFQILKLSVNARLRHLLRTLLVKTPSGKLLQISLYARTKLFSTYF